MALAQSQKDLGVLAVFFQIRGERLPFPEFDAHCNSDRRVGAAFNDVLADADAIIFGKIPQLPHIVLKTEVGALIRPVPKRMKQFWKVRTQYEERNPVAVIEVSPGNLPKNLLAIGVLASRHSEHVQEFGLRMIADQRLHLSDEVRRLVTGQLVLHEVRPLTCLNKAYLLAPTAERAPRRFAPLRGRLSRRHECLPELRFARFVMHEVGSGSGQTRDS